MDSSDVFGVDDNIPVLTYIQGVVQLMDGSIGRIRCPLFQRVHVWTTIGITGRSRSYIWGSV